MADEKQQAALDKATNKGAAAGRKRINTLITEANSAAGEIEDKAAKKAVKDVLKQLKADIKDGAATA